MSKGTQSFNMRVSTQSAPQASLTPRVFRDGRMSKKFKLSKTVTETVKCLFIALTLRISGIELKINKTFSLNDNCLYTLYARPLINYFILLVIPYSNRNLHNYLKSCSKDKIKKYIFISLHWCKLGY